MKITEINKNLLKWVDEMDLIDSDKLNIDCKVQKDLGITGDDAVDFIEEFAKEFGVDISLFDYSKYFDGEGINISEVISRLFFRENSSNHTDMSLHNLAEAIRDKKLV